MLSCHPSPITPLFGGSPEVRPVPRSARLTLADVRRAVRLVDECREQGDDPGRWGGHLLGGLIPLVGGAMGMVGEFAFRGGRPLPSGLAETGWPSDRDRAYWERWVREPGMPGHPALAAFAARPAGTFARPDLVADREWEADRHVNEVLRPAGIDEGLVSGVRLADGRTHLITLARGRAGRPFGPSERRLVEFLHAELARHLGRSLAGYSGPAAGLTPRLRQVLDELLGGDPEKSIARRLGITPDTLHGYVKQVYRAFGTTSRAELLAHFLRRHRRPPGPG